MLTEILSELKRILMSMMGSRGHPRRHDIVYRYVTLGHRHVVSWDTVQYPFPTMVDENSVISHDEFWNYCQVFNLKASPLLDVLLLAAVMDWFTSLSHELRFSQTNAVRYVTAV
jgi:hypothetical protein